MPNEFSVVGEHRLDDTHLLVLGIDGQYYRYFPERDQFTPIEPGEEWVISQGPDEVEPEFFGLEMEQESG